MRFATVVFALLTAVIAAPTSLESRGTLTCPVNKSPYYGSCVASCSLRVLGGLQGKLQVTALSNNKILGFVSAVPNSGFYGIYPDYSDLFVNIHPSATGILFRTLTIPSQFVVAPGFTFLGVAHALGPVFSKTSPSYAFLTANMADVPGGGPGASVLVAKPPANIVVPVPAIAVPTSTNPGESAVWRVDGCTNAVTATWTNPDQKTFFPLKAFYDTSDNNIVFTPSIAVLENNGIGSPANVVPISLKFIQMNAA